MRIAGLALVVGSLAILLPIMHHAVSPVYRPVVDSASAPAAVAVSVRHAGNLNGVSRVACPAAGGDVLQFGKDGTGQVEFSWPVGALADRSYRVWARVLPGAERGEIRVGVAHPSGVSGSTYLPLGSPRRWQWLDLGEFVGAGEGPERLRLTGLGETEWQLMGLCAVPGGDTEEPPPPPMTLVERAGRQFGDRFDRSPGHGLGAWQERSGAWGIQFSLDPNRVPMQYSLHGSLAADGSEGILLVDGPEWLGSRTEASVFPEPGASCGIVLATAAGDERYEISAGDGGGAEVAPHQWYRLTVEAWGWTRRFLVDGVEVSVRHDAEPLAHRPGLLLTAGEARFDDVRVAEVSWCAEDAWAYRMPWRLSGETPDWGVRAKGRKAALHGVAGDLLPALGMAPAREVVVWNASPGPKVVGPGLAAVSFPSGTEYRFAEATAAWGLRAPGDAARVAVCSFDEPDDEFRIGPYRFEARTIPDPSDYLDFTPEEWEAIRTSPEADKLARKPKQTQVVGRSNEYAIWETKEGLWRVQDGALVARAGRHASRVRFWQSLDGAYTLRFRVRLADPSAWASVQLGELGGRATDVLLHSNSTDIDYAGTGVAVPIEPRSWVDVRVEFGMDTLTVQTRGEGADGWTAPSSKAVVRGIGGGLELVAGGGEVAFDDVEVAVPRRRDTQWFYAFDRRECDWLRDGPHWIDHGGVSCALASNWVSLVAPEEHCMLWHKGSFGGDVMVSTNIEENSEWMGWDKDPSHVHYPYDNVVLSLGESADVDTGYRLEVNSRDRTQTVLYREGKEVASVRQGQGFPIRYLGGHAPYRPRRNRIMLVREGDQIRGLVDGQVVVSYTDPSPLPPKTVGRGGYRTHLNFSRIMVRELTQAK
jgi:hypothetical protein